MVKEYFTECKDIKSRQIITKFLLRKTHILRLSNIPWVEGKGFIKFKKYGTLEDKKFLQTRNKLKKDFIKTITNNKRFNDLSQGGKSRYTHYFYKISPEMKQKVENDTVFWNTNPPTSKNFYGFEDPTFYKGKTIIGSIISHEGYIFLYLNPEDKKYLESHDIKLEKRSN